MQNMDRQSKLAEIKLVSKYYPVANYSYPRKEDAASPTSPTSPSISYRDRCSVGSEGSAPGLIDDRTDSELSQEDDYQYHTHTTELWDSFWQPGGEWRLEDPHVDLLLPMKEEYPALIPSPQHKRQPSPKLQERNSPAWPLPSRSKPANTPSGAARNTRKPAATYSAFPTVRAHPHRNSLVPASLSPKAPTTATMAAACMPPPRPERPDALLTPCLEQPAQIPAAFGTNAIIPPRSDSRPKTSGTPKRPGKVADMYPREAGNVFGFHSSASQSTEDLIQVQPAQEVQRPPRHYKSTTYLGAARQQQIQQRLMELPQQRSQQPEAEPHSVFEDDSDGEESARISFFRFHKRSGSDKSYKSSFAAVQEAALNRRHRNRADTISVSPTSKPPSSERERKVDVFGRMLGRRSR